jgi:hypothetical protein
MRSIMFGVAASFVLFASAALAQQPVTGAMPGGESFSHPPPPPLGGPPPDLSATGSTPKIGDPAPNGYTGAYLPSNAPPSPYSTGPLLTSSSGPGLNVEGPEFTTRTVKAVPCTTSARETDGSTTCVGIPDRSDNGARHHRR